MQQIIKNKLVIPVVALAIVGVVGATYTMTHSGSSTANAQTAVTKGNSQADQDKETKDAVSPKPSHAAEQADINEKDKADTNGSTNEKEDGN